jgi:two-component system response regulator ChvI
MEFGIPTQAEPASEISATMAGTPDAASLSDMIVVIDDNDLVGEALAANLEAAGFKALWIQNGSAALEYFSDGGHAAAILLDWSMPGMDGPEVLRRMRLAGHSAPVLVLTGHGQPMFEETALAAGAVDFVEKSRSFAIVVHRLKLALAGAKRQRRTLARTGLHIDEDSARAFWNGHLVDLTISEFKVVRFLAANAGRDVSYRAIYDLVRGEGFQAGAGEHGYRANVRAMVRRVRQSFGSVDPEFDAIENYAGFGYRWLAMTRRRGRAAFGPEDAAERPAMAS